MDPKQDPSPPVPDPVELLQQLIRFDTTNPPGNEAECIAFIHRLLARAGVEAKILAKSPDRPNLIARLPGAGEAAPLMLYGHVDVVTTENQRWQHPPFEGRLVDDYVWGRGALDMKSGVAMMVTALLRAKAENARLPGDVLLTVVADEEAGGEFGARFLVEEHPDEFAGVRYALGEFGGFTFTIGKRRLYPIQIAEKQVCWLKVTWHGPGGHGSMPVRDGAMAKLGRCLQQLDTRPLPVHITPPARMMFRAVASAVGGPAGWLIAQLLNPRLTDSVLKLLGDRGRLFSPLLRHTVSPTMLEASSKINVIPGEVSLGLDGRLLPGFGSADLIGELRAIIGDEAQIEVLHHDPGPADPDMGLFDTLAGILREADPAGVPVPLMLSGSTDGQFFARLGIQSYGFTPMQLPADFNLIGGIHAADERIPAGALEFGAHAIYRALQRFG